MSHICEHAILIDTECAVINTEKKWVQAIQKAECDHLEVNSSNSTIGCGSSGCAGRWGDNSSGCNIDQMVEEDEEVVVMIPTTKTMQVADMPTTSWISAILSTCWVSLWTDLLGSLATTNLLSIGPPFPTPLSPNAGMHCLTTIAVKLLLPALSALNSCLVMKIPVISLPRPSACIFGESFLFWKGGTMSSDPSTHRGVTG